MTPNITNACLVLFNYEVKLADHACFFSGEELLDVETADILFNDMNWVSDIRNNINPSPLHKALQKLGI